MQLPALFASADRAADARQKLYLRLIMAEYALLLLASILSVNSAVTSREYYAGYALVFVGLICVLLYRTLKKPEQAWYLCRACAESAKTLPWRYVMRAEPFDGQDGRIAREKFIGQFRDLLRSNPELADAIAGVHHLGPQVTAEMEEIRSRPMDERIKYYLNDRVMDQLSWYARKAAWNKSRAALWTLIGVGTYVVATALVLLRVADPGALGPMWPIEPLILVAAVVLGWMQVKKFNELASAYTLTAHEISLVRDRFASVANDAELAQLVSESELAFSREHTQWVARVQR